MTDKLGALAGRRIAVGAPGSGTEAMARALLEGLGLPTTGQNLLALPASDARGQLETGAIDAAFFVSSYRDAHVAALLRRPDVHLLSFRRDAAFTGNFRYLSAVRVSPGLLDLKADLPREPIRLMAPAVLLDPPGRFPTRDGVDVPLHDAADSYLSRGESFLSRVLPYWALRWVIQLRVLLLPLIAIWVPLFKILPWLLRWRGNRMLERHYALLRDAEAAVAAAAGPEALREEVARRLSLPHQRDVYHCRLHVGLVLNEARDRLLRTEHAPPR